MNCNGASEYGRVSRSCYSHKRIGPLVRKRALFEKIPAFQKIENFLLQLYYLCEKSPVRLRVLHELSSAYQELIPKPTKANGTRWLEHKYVAIKIALENFEAYIPHLEELAQTDFKPEKRAQTKKAV